MMKNSATARERELYRYYQPDETNSASISDRLADPELRKSSNDPILTAFAQLGALRLNAKRGVIILTSSSTEFIIAESSQSLSLQQDNDENDRLWHGIGAFDCGSGAGPKLVEHFCMNEDEKFLMFPDLMKEERFQNNKMVLEEPFIRSLTCVPLRTPGYGLVIGSYMVVDDRVREDLDESHIQFMIDMGATVMDYLQSGLVKRKQHRAERMVKAMGLFIEGKSTLRDWWMEAGHKSQQAHILKRNLKTSATIDILADSEFGVQDPTDFFSKNGFNGTSSLDQRPNLSRNVSSSTPSLADVGDGRPMMLPRGQSNVSTDMSSLPTPGSAMSMVWNHNRNSSVTTAEDSGVEDDAPHKSNSVSFDLPPEEPSVDVSKELQDAVLSGDMRGVFARAGNLIREAIGVEGVIYYDASVGSFGGSSERTVMDEKAPGAFKVDGMEHENLDHHGRKMSIASFGMSDNAAVSSAQDTDTAPEKCCNILGFSTRRRSTLKGHPTSEKHRLFPETILRRLLKKYPHGKVFNFDEDGQMSSDSDPTSSGVDTSAEKYSFMPSSIELKMRQKRQSREAEAKAILKVLPGARSVFWFPLWDSSRDRWFAGSLVWSTSPTRVLCPVEDLTYLAAFGNSVMAEVARISAQVLAQMKTDFISSISHEFRSPIHGVLASVEFLQETEMTEFQSDMVSNIHASGKVLLDTVNHVLDFSKVNRKSKNKTRLSKKSAKRFRKSKERGIIEDSLDDSSNICVLSEEVIESIYAGHRVKKHAFGSSTDRHLSMTTMDNPVTVIVDIECRTNWCFDIDAGAWRRILMNLFSNAMKYTKKGFIKISIEIEDDVSSRGKQQRSNLVLKVTDSGRGISQEFLRHQLFKPFKQEDSLASGAGLGLSIIRHIIQDLGGHIEFSSEKGTGTEASVRIPLAAASTPSSVSEPDMIAEVKAITTGFKFSLEGFERYPDITEQPTGILSSDVEAAMYLKETTTTVLTNWFGMEASAVNSPFGSANADVVMIMEAGLGKTSLDAILEPYCQNRDVGGKRPIAVVLCNNYHPTMKTEPHSHFDVFHLQQPYGPHKLAKIFHRVLCQQKVDTPSSPSTTNGSYRGLQVQPPPFLRGVTEQIVTPTVSFSPISTIKENRPPLVTNVTSTGLWSKEPPTPTLWTPVTEKPTFIVTTEPKVDVVAQLESRGLRVLLVEDNEINLKLLVAYMRKLKLDHSTATNGLEALDTYKDSEGKYDVIFMDISMPIMDGIESTQHIRRFEREHSLPPVALIALTGAANPNTRQEAFSSGIDLFLTKPVPMKALKVMLDDLKKNGRDGLGVAGFDGN